ncbi:multicopper oxidase family protein [Mycobacterium sp.]|uniref:multicopper oxidase family protein n=1 Tax=Mycobacterium sp. TaxID=1785 RepID=UPI003A8365F3
MSTPASTVVSVLDHFPTDPAGLPEAVPPQIVELRDGDSYELRVAPVAKRLGDTTVRLLAYNGSVPGPQLRVRQGSEIIVTAINDGDTPTTVHWHGLRLENRYDGTPHTQVPIPVGGRFTYRVRFPDPGVYWYHPHVRHDYNLEMGSYGAIVVAPGDEDYWPRVDREVALTLDDFLIENGQAAPFSRNRTTYAAMGRYGNVLLVNGESDYSTTARRGEVVRFHLVNTANTRTFNVTFAGARMKLVGGDSGHYEFERIVEEVMISPSERAVIDVLFDEPGPVAFEHRTPDHTYVLGAITVAGEASDPSAARGFGDLRTSDDMVAERHRLAEYLGVEPDKTLELVAEMDHTLIPPAEGDTTVALAAEGDHPFPLGGGAVGRWGGDVGDGGDGGGGGGGGSAGPPLPQCRRRPRPIASPDRVGRPHGGDEPDVDRCHHALEAGRARHWR